MEQREQNRERRKVARTKVAKRPTRALGDLVSSRANLDPSHGLAQLLVTAVRLAVASIGVAAYR